MLAVAGCPESTTVTVPDVAGLSQSSAGVTLAAVGLAVGTITEQPSGTLPEGTVINTKPAAGATVTHGSAVHLVVVQSASSVAVPDVVGQSQSAASAILTSAGLTAGLVTQQFSNTVPVGKVIIQSPGAGSTVAPGSPVNLFVSRGSATVSVPNIVGQTQSAASTTLSASGLSVGAVTQESSATVAAGSVISQSPAAGAHAGAGSVVDLVVSRGAPSVAVPNVTGFTQSVAASLLSLAKLNVGTVTQDFSDAVPVGRVLNQNPAVGVRVMAGDAVDLVLSKGVAPVTIPDVTGLSRANAETALVGAGLVLGSTTERFNETVPEGNVISQYPVAGTSAALGAAVNLALSGGSAPVTVPNVCGITQSAAEFSLTFSGLVLGTVGEAFSDTVPLGRVATQSPAKGTSVASGSPVNLVLSKGPAPVVVPDVVGMTLPVAEAAIDTARLRVGTVSLKYSETVPQNEVISQTPAEGDTVPPKTPVDMVVSKGREPVPVPDVTGLARGDADAAIIAAQLVVGTVSELYSDTVTTGHVISQDPAVGWDVQPGTEVDLVVSKGAKPVYVPDVLDRTLAFAERMLRSARVELGAVSEQYSDSVVAGSVISQDPRPWARVLPGTSVDLVVSKGLKPILVPDLRGLSWSLARSIIGGRGLELGAFSWQYSDTVPIDIVISQSPVGDELVQPGSRVDLVVSKGVEPVGVPDVVGLEQAEAGSALTAATLAIGVVTEAYSDTVPTGRVISQDPAAGSSALPGTAVNLVVSKGRESVQVPDVVGLVRSAAEATIATGKLVVGTVSMQYSDIVPVANVIGQSPAAGETVFSNTSIDLVVSLGPEPVQVPDVLGLPYMAAEAAIVNGGLVVDSVSWQQSDTVPAGNVIGQTPVAGGTVQPGTAVSLVVSRGVDYAGILTVDVDALSLSTMRPTGTVTVTGTGAGTLRWTAVASDSAIEVSPGAFTGNSKEVTIRVTNFSKSHTGRVIFRNDEDPLDFEVVNVQVAFPLAGQMLPVSAGDFEMGEEGGEENAQPVHTVTLSPYWIGKYEVTNQEYVNALNWANSQGLVSIEAPHASVQGYDQKLLNLRVYYSWVNYLDGRFHVLSDDGESMAEYPVSPVTWYGAAIYCNWLSEANGLEPCYDTSTWECDFSKNGYHLPTEAQWERAAAWDGSNHWAYGFTSDDIDGTRCNCSESGLYNQWVVPVGYYNGLNGAVDSPSPVGCYDMSGNVEEWCNDWYGASFYATSPTADPKGPSVGTLRVLRGGSRRSPLEACRSAFRSSHEPGDASRDQFGFRLARGSEDGVLKAMVPSVAGLSQAEAEGGLAFAGLTVGTVTHQHSETVPDGHVIGQDPVAGARVVLETPVDLIVASGSVSPPSDLEVDVKDVNLMMPSPSAVVTVRNAGGGTLSWTAVVDNPAIMVTPDGGSGNTTEVTVSTGVFAEPATARVIIMNSEDASDFEVVEVRVTVPLPCEMVPVPAGPFEMGDPWGRIVEGAAHEYPVHTVTLSAYEIGKYEVTNQEFADVLNWANARGYLEVVSSDDLRAYGRPLLWMYFLNRLEYKDGQFIVASSEGSAMVDHPMHDLTWYGAAVFCNWLSEVTGLDPCYDTTTWECNFSKNGYHLPTEAQWERAAAWDGSRHYRYAFFGDSNDRTRSNYIAEGFVGPEPFEHTTPVGFHDGRAGTTDSPSPVGCYDMSGNAGEWCHDWYDEEYYANSPLVDPTGPVSGERRVQRGGCFNERVFASRSCSRSALEPYDSWIGWGGIRVARQVNSHDVVEVPDVTGLAELSARRAITSAVLVVGARDEQFSESVPKGHVISQSPTPGTWKGWGAPVHLVVSFGSASGTPDLAVDTVSVALTDASPSSVVEVCNIGEGTLRWKAVTNDPGIRVAPSTFVGNRAEVTISTVDVSMSFMGAVTFVSMGDWADHAVTGVNVTAVLADPDVPGEMIAVPAGSFEMGEPWDGGWPYARPVHTVFLSAYEIGKFEVTNQEFVGVLNWAQARGYLDPVTPEAFEAYGMRLMKWAGDRNGCQIAYVGGQFLVESREGYLMADHPVVEVTWYGGAAYCNWLSEMEGLQPCYDTSTWECDFSRNGYHLPTEAQWERAAAWDGLRHWRYGFASDRIDATRANYRVESIHVGSYDYSVYCNPLGFHSKPYTSPIGYFCGENGTVNSPSPVGCYDMTGNAAEWCNDWWAWRNYAEGPAEDLTGPEPPLSFAVRVMRGGSWWWDAHYVRSASRWPGEHPNSTDSNNGFRVAR